ncbi:peptidyl-dipeptidase Dcp [Nakamurella flavida]|uniref:M3 family metallopeptidase n=1 Tax=Nakamurella flavida TaxID=363630 RepID=UPI00278485E8|nr:M3 family metallopeptidase [Nakamurella flavida]MDP9778689.1 peptidyl-dipeptidase Dcp [Nakamurella flavida]
MPSVDLSDTNPFAAPSTLPFALPPFAGIGEDDYAPAFDAGMAAHRAEVDAILADPEPASFENTVVALERAGQLLGRVSAVFFNLVSSTSTPGLQRIEAEYSPKLSAHSDAIRLDPALFARIDAVHAGRHDAGLDTEALALIERYHTDLVLAGAQLGESDRATLTDLNQRLSVLSTTFRQNLLRAMENAAVLVDDAVELDGASPAAVATAAAAAAERGDDGYLIPLILPTSQPLLAVLRNRDLRRRLFTASVGRASAGDEDNGPVLVEIARLRAVRAQLLGFPTHAEATLADQVAKTSAAVDDLLGRLVAPAVANANAEAAVLAEYAAQDGVELAPWDWAYYAERVRADRYQVDTAALRSYFELDRVLVDGVFHAAEQVYGITMTARPDLTGYHPDVRVWEARNADGSPIGLYLGDYYARTGKRGGAWMNSFVDQSDLMGTLPVVVNVLNINKPPAGDPTLLSLDEVRTLFHEFGHALHGLFSRVRYPRLSGTSVPRDVVEFPSQVNEMWISRPEILAHYARHVDTGEALPQEQVDKLEAAERWGQGFGTSEYLAATLLDQAWHRISPTDEITDVDAFEQQALERAGIALELVPPRYRSRYFQHVFSGGYSAGYYSYIWAEVLDADTVEWFGEGGLPRENGQRFRDRLLSVGGSVEMGAAFRAVTGRDPRIEPLLERRGLVATG